MFPLLLLTFVCGTLGWLVWVPYGVFLGVLPPVVVFGVAFVELSSTSSSPPMLPSARPSPPLSLDGRVDLTAALHGAGVFATDADDSLSLSPQFADDWRTRMLETEGRSRDREALAGLLGVDPDRVEMGWNERGLFARLDRGTVGQWASRAAFVADLTAVATFRRYYPEWWRLSTADRNRVLGALRLCLRTCPTCDGAVTVETEQVGSSERDGTKRRVSATCRGCDASLFDGVVEQSAAEQSGSDEGAGVHPQNTR
ncbi:hypothetical protein [Haloferax marisrubri]|uniref:Uncharacterized protein n=1 Tax=Haloferax marisrubri TaxID=1544719 RepID=A0A2P4NTZ8_9EURY|nr:hypothetical protein [Haloferax marisrubri]POG56601.1 hypothetical protein AUR65_004520 [Haloferax marisrubri]